MRVSVRSEDLNSATFCALRPPMPYAPSCLTWLSGVKGGDRYQKCTECWELSQQNSLIKPLSKEISEEQQQILVLYVKKLNKSTANKILINSLFWEEPPLSFSLAKVGLGVFTTVLWWHRKSAGLSQALRISLNTCPVGQCLLTA